MVLVIIILGAVFLICLRYRGDSAQKTTSQSPGGPKTIDSYESAKAEAERWAQVIEEKYFQSPLTKKIIATVSDESGQKPEQIEIYSDKVVGRTDGVTRVFDFLTERVPKLEATGGKYIPTGYSAIDSMESSPEKSLAVAINRLLGGEYEMKALYKDPYHSKYRDHIILTLKANVNF